jgi:hypothetical protein
MGINAGRDDRVKERPLPDLIHSIRNELVVPLGLLELLRDRTDLPSDVPAQIELAIAALERATAELARLHARVAGLGGAEPRS